MEMSLGCFCNAEPDMYALSRRAYISGKSLMPMHVTTDNLKFVQMYSLIVSTHGYD